MQVEKQKTELQMNLAQQRFELDKQLAIIKLQMDQANREADAEHQDRLQTRKMKFEANGKRVAQGEDLDGEGNITMSQPVMDALAKLDKLFQLQNQTHEAVTAPRKIELARDAKGKVSHAISKVQH